MYKQSILHILSNQRHGEIAEPKPKPIAYNTRLVTSLTEDIP
jgi:hypothetical protein